MNQNQSSLILKVKEVTKTFPGTIALDKVNFDLKKGEVHAIVGENGAGKSTLMKILSGVYTKDSGSLYLNGGKVDITGVNDSIDLGISMIYQELENILKITVAENIFIGRLPESRVKGFVNFRKLFKDTKNILEEFKIDINPREVLSNLSIANQQFIEIIKAVTTKNARIIIMDEPTSSLTKDETGKLFQIIEDLKGKGISIIYISHRLDEITGIADRVSVFRDGKNVGTLDKNEFSSEKIITMMIGHELKEIEKEYKLKEKVIFEVKDLNIKNHINDFSLKVHEGEILGIAGLMGSGKDELVKSLFGLWPAASKEIYFMGKRLSIKSPRDAVNLGIVYLPEERKIQSLFLDLSVSDNITPIWLFHIYKKFFLSSRREKRLSLDYIKKLSIKTPSPNQKSINLSGGNQQKVILSRLISVKPKLMILNDPTRGVDIGSKEEIHDLISQLADQGTSFIVLSSEIPEISKISDRVIVLSKGNICGEFISSDVTTKNILVCATKA